MKTRLGASFLALAAGVAAVVIVALLLAPLARADGDPASDYLLGRALFSPPDAGIASADQEALTSLLQSARAQAYPLRVAIIASRYDMGAVTILYKRPRDYAPFLSQEVRFLYKGRVLVVMPNGWAIGRNGKRDPAEQKIVERLPVPKPFQGAALAAATESAVRRLAAGEGIVLPKTAAPTSGERSSSSDRILIAVVAAVALIVAFGVSFWRRRARSAPGRSR